MLRRTQTLYVTTDPFFSQRGKVLHRFDQFLAELAQSQIPCVWMTGRTRAQVDEPRRRLGQSDPYIGESGCGVYLPEDYFHLKAGNTIRLGRFTCVPIAKPQPAAAEALDELSSDLGISTVSLRSLSLRELSQNTGLPTGEAEQIRMRDFDELFFFAGASEPDIRKFTDEAKLRDLTLQNLGAFWSLSCGADLRKCIRELGGLYDRALRAHVLRVGVAVTPSNDSALAINADPRLKSLVASCDRTLFLTERQVASDLNRSAVSIDDSANDPREATVANSTGQLDSSHHLGNSFYLHAPDVWERLLEAILARR